MAVADHRVIGDRRIRVLPSAWHGGDLPETVIRLSRRVDDTAMWLYIVALVIVILGIVGGVASGGIFAIVLVPLGLIVAGPAVLYAMWGRRRLADARCSAQ